jgi:BON domain
VGALADTTTTSSARHEPNIAALSRRLHIPVSDVDAIYARKLSRLAADARIKGFLCALAISNMRRILREPTGGQRTQAEETVRNVKWGGQGRQYHHAHPCQDTAPKMDQGCRRGLAAERPTVDASRISVETSGAHVTLRRRVRTWAERRWAAECAAAIAGVEGVSNELIVRYPELPSDLYGAA